MSAARLQAKEGGVLLWVRVQPKARREGVTAVHDGALKIALKAPPVDGAANTALIRFIARSVGVPRGSVQITRGHAARDKTVLIADISTAEVSRVIEGLLETNC